MDATDAPLVLCIGTSADQLAAITRATGGRVTVMYLPDASGLTSAIAAPAVPPVVVVDESTRAHRVVEAGKLRLNADLREATWRGTVLPLSAREFDMLYALTHDPGRVWTFAELTTHVWERPFLGDTEAVVSAVKRLRRPLRAAAPGVRVESVRGVGYRLVIMD
jgi:DNA-binding response OmpR family regulator